VQGVTRYLCDGCKLVERCVAEGSGFPTRVVCLFTADPEDTASRAQERKVLRGYTLRAQIVQRHPDQFGVRVCGRFARIKKLAVRHRPASKIENPIDGAIDSKNEKLCYIVSVRSSPLAVGRV